MFDITVIIIFHKEGNLCIPALSSMKDMIDRARDKGLRIEARAVLDKPDAITKSMVYDRGAFLDHIDEVDVGDLGLARNIGTQNASGQFLAFLDGDDLWGDEWLTLAHQEATQPNAPIIGVWHPSTLYYFSTKDYNNHSLTANPKAGLEGFYFNHFSSQDDAFNKNTLFLNNVWSANFFAHREVYLNNPYKPVMRDSGFGIEDWSWNLETVWKNIPHLVVRNTVHIIRLKEFGSLGKQNTAEGLLVHLEDGHSPIIDKK